ncbi:MAG: TonB-dependent receptor [Pseudoxanthomonas sp.]
MSYRVSKRIQQQSHRTLLFSAMSVALFSTAWSAGAADAPPAQAQPAQDQDGSGTAADEGVKQMKNVNVVGSQIANSRAEAALPVTVMGKEEIEATGAVNGNDLIRSMPQMGDITWNPTFLGGGSSNAARGDMGSINLKNLGASNTLLLINGRRSVIHPAMQTSDGGVSATSYNSNAIPMYGLQRLEVLRDGAAAIYGSDAIAGVVNVVTQSNLENGGGIQLQYGSAPGTNLTDKEVSGYFGHDFQEGRGNVSVMYSFQDRQPVYASDVWYTATTDRRDFFSNELQGLGALDTRSTSTPWGYFRSTGGTVSRNGSALTNSGGYFHIQPSTNSGCASDLGNGICIDDGQATTSGADRNLRYETTEPGVTSVAENQRASVFSTFRYDLTDNLEFFGEAALYNAKTRATVSSGATATTQPVYVPASNYWNPLGAATLPDGSANPNRLSGLTGVPDEGVAVELRNYRFADGGTRLVKTTNTQNRFLGGLRGWFDSFQWESALLYSAARSVDDSQAYSVSEFVNALSLSTPEAYNPFNGGSLSNPSMGDETPSNADAFKVWTRRTSRSSLALWDFKLSKSDLLALPTGDLGAAVGVEVRRETYEDDRDPRVDGTVTYTAGYTGTTYDSDLMGTSATPDIEGDRVVKSAFVEFAVPLVKPEWGIPLLRSLDLQVAGRFESYSDVGDIAKPKVALAWGVADGLLIRGSWSEGFKAPNLEVLNSPGLMRYNTRTDWIRCEADLRAGRIGQYADCSQSYSVQSLRSGNPGLDPETSTSISAGFVFEPTFIPDRFGHFTFTADWWKIKQEGVIGIVGEQNGLIIDAYQRVVNGSSNPAVVRMDPTPTDIEEFAGTGLEPVGEVLYVEDQYMNLAPIEAEGLDLSASWALRGTRFGDFSVTINATQLRHYTQEMIPELAEALAAQQAGLLDGYITIGAGGEEQVGMNGLKPEWKTTGSFIWHLGGHTVRTTSQYVGSLYSGSWPDGSDYLVDSTLTHNLSYGYRFSDESKLAGFSFEVGARNVFDKDPPLAADGTYLATLYQPYGRYLYFNVQKTF